MTSHRKSVRDVAAAAGISTEWVRQLRGRGIDDAEIEAGTYPRSPGGRPRLRAPGAPRPRGPKIVVYCTHGEHRRVKALAAQAGLTVSSYVRRALGLADE